MIFDGLDPASVYHGIEMRNCPAPECGSTLGRELAPYAAIAETLPPPTYMDDEPYRSGRRLREVSL
jgi:hypothetical protein